MSRSCFSRHLKAVLCILIACFLLTGTVECRAAHAENVEAVSDFDYAFEHDYVDQKWAQEDPNRQISSAEFKLMLTRIKHNHCCLPFHSAVALAPPSRESFFV